MAQAIDIDDDGLPTHWLHAAYAGADAPALIAARKAEVAGLFLGDAKERGVRDACARGDQAYVARACGTLKSLGDLRVPIAAQERCDWARACVDGANVADAPVCVVIKILRHVSAESSRRPPRHRRDACSMHPTHWLISTQVAARARVPHAPLRGVAQEEARDLGLARGEQRGRVGAGVGGVEPVRREVSFRVVDVDVYGGAHRALSVHNRRLTKSGSACGCALYTLGRDSRQ